MNKTQISMLIRTSLLKQLWVPKHVVDFMCVVYFASRSAFIEKYTEHCSKFKPYNKRVSPNGHYGVQCPRTDTILHLLPRLRISGVLPPFFPIYFYFSAFGINLLKPTGYVMHQQLNNQQLYALPTLYLCVLYLSENKQRLVPLTA